MILSPNLQSFRNKEQSKEYKKGKRSSFDLEEFSAGSQDQEIKGPPYTHVPHLQQQGPMTGLPPVTWLP